MSGLVAVCSIVAWYSHPMRMFTSRHGFGMRSHFSKPPPSTKFHEHPLSSFFCCYIRTDGQTHRWQQAHYATVSFERAIDSCPCPESTPVIHSVARNVAGLAWCTVNRTICRHSLESARGREPLGASSNSLEHTSILSSQVYTAVQAVSAHKICSS